MPLNDLLAIATALGQVLQAIVVAATLIYVIQQTNLTRKSVQDVERQTKVGITTNMDLYIGQLNDILLRDEGLAKLFGWSKADLVAFSFLNNLEMRFFAHKQGATDDLTWQSDRTLIADIVQREFIQQTWQRYKGEYYPEFVQFVDELTQVVKSKMVPNTDKDGA